MLLNNSIKSFAKLLSSAKTEKEIPYGGGYSLLARRWCRSWRPISAVPLTVTTSRWPAIGRIAEAVASSFAADAGELHSTGRVVIRQHVSGRQHEDCTDESSA